MYTQGHKEIHLVSGSKPAEIIKEYYKLANIVPLA
jgi:2-iminoacetate synthase ThiH